MPLNVEGYEIQSRDVRMYEQTNIVRSGLVLHLDASIFNTVPLGSTWYDLSGNGNNGTLNGGLNFSGNQISFDGSNDYIDLGDNTLNGANEPFAENNTKFSISYFARVTSFLSNDSNHGISNTILGKSDDNSNDNFEMGYSPGGNFEFYVDDKSNDVNDVETSIQVATGEWHHITVVYDVSKTNDFVVYFNGSLSQSYNLGFSGMDNADGSALTLGNSRRNRSWLNGDISQISIYNRALSATEIAHNYNVTKGRFGL